MKKIITVSRSFLFGEIKFTLVSKTLLCWIIMCKLSNDLHVAITNTFCGNLVIKSIKIEDNTLTLKSGRISLKKYYYKKNWITSCSNGHIESKSSKIKTEGEFTIASWIKLWSFNWHVSVLSPAIVLHEIKTL